MFLFFDWPCVLVFGGPTGKLQIFFRRRTCVNQYPVHLCQKIRNARPGSSSSAAVAIDTGSALSVFVQFLLVRTSERRHSSCCLCCSIVAHSRTHMGIQYILQPMFRTDQRKLFFCYQRTINKYVVLPFCAVSM